MASAHLERLLANIVASRGIEIPGRNGQTSQGLDLGLPESCFGRARRRGLVCQGGVRHRSKSEVCVAHALKHLNFQFNSCAGRQRLRQFERELKRSDRIAMRKSPGGVLRSKYQVGDCLVIFSATLEM